MSALGRVISRMGALVQDPPPEFVFEIAADGIAMSRTRPPAALQHSALQAGVIAPSPVKDNILDYEAFAGAVARLVPVSGSRGRRGCTLILPDGSVRVATLDFDTLPVKEEERLSLIKFRLRKTLPFDVDEAAFSYCVQKGNKVLAAVAPVEIIARYEAPFRAAGLHPGLVTSSSLAMLDLLPFTGTFMVAHRSPGALTVLAITNGILTLARSLEMTAGETDPLEEISADLYPTLIYIEDQTGLRPEKLMIAGFGPESEESATRLAVDLDTTVEVIADPHPGLAGYLRSLAPGSLAPGSLAPTAEKAAA
jgi:type IV pilus assembly protein PilM